MTFSKKILSVAIAAFAIGILAPKPASAAVYSFSFDGANYDVVGQFTTNLTNNILSISGLVTSLTGTTAGFDGPIGALITGPTNPFPGNVSAGWTFTNTYDPIGNVFGGDGVLFSFGAGNIGNIYGGTNGFFSVDAPPSLFNPGDQGTLAISAVPEASTWMMMLLGFAGVGFFAFKRSKKLATIAA